MALGVEHDEVHDGDREHVAVPLENLRVWDVERFAGGVNDGAVLVHDAVGGHGGAGGGVVEGEGGREFAAKSAGEGDTVVFVLSVASFGDIEIS